MERRIRIVGLCLLAVFALGAVMASAASASVEFGQCVKLPKPVTKKYKGHFTDKNCQTPATAEEISLGGTGNKYNFEAGSGHLTKFASKAKAITFKAEDFEIICKKGTGEGNVHNANTIFASWRFSSCTNKLTGEKCHSPKSAIGEIETASLVGTVSENVKKEVEVSLSHKGAGGVAEPTEPWVTFECPGTVFTLNGLLGAISTQTTNAMTKKGGLKASETTGEQELEATFPNPLNKSEIEEEPATLSFESTFKFEESYEMRQQ